MIFEYWKKPDRVIVSDNVAYGYNGLIRLARHGSEVNPDYLMKGIKPDLIVLRFSQFNRICAYV